MISQLSLNERLAFDLGPKIAFAFSETRGFAPSEVSYNGKLLGTLKFVRFKGGFALREGRSKRGLTVSLFFCYIVISKGNLCRKGMFSAVQRPIIALCRADCFSS